MRGEVHIYLLEKTLELTKHTPGPSVKLYLPRDVSGPIRRDHGRPSKDEENECKSHRETLCLFILSLS